MIDKENLDPVTVEITFKDQYGDIHSSIINYEHREMFYNDPEPILHSLKAFLRLSLVKEEVLERTINV